MYTHTHEHIHTIPVTCVHDRWKSTLILYCRYSSKETNYSTKYQDDEECFAIICLFQEEVEIYHPNGDIILLKYKMAQS